MQNEFLNYLEKVNFSCVLFLVENRPGPENHLYHTHKYFYAKL